MATRVTLPLLGQTMEEGTILQWYKSEGEQVKLEEPLLEVMTDKANMEVESPAEGTLLKIIAQPDATVPVKALIGVIGAPGEDISAILAEAPEGASAAPAGGQATAAAAAPPAAATASAATAGVEQAAPQGQAQQPSAAVGDATGIKASPRARKIAEENGLDITLLAGKGSGPSGRIIEKDVLKAIESDFAAAPAATQAAVAATPLAQKMAAEAGVALGDVAGSGPGGKIRSEDLAQAAKPAHAAGARPEMGKLIPFSGMRKAVSDNLERSARSVVPVTLTVSVDMSEAVKLREQVKPLYEKRYGVKLGYTDIIVKAASKAVEDYPIVNSALEGDKIRVHDSVHMCVSVALDDGLVAPAVRDANLKPLWSISAEIADLAGRAKAGKLSGQELSGGTITLTTLGMFGVEQFNAIINPPQAAIIAVCAIKEQPVVVEGQVVVRPMMNLCLTFDHRILDGAPAAQYLARLKELLEQPYLFLA